MSRCAPTKLVLLSLLLFPFAASASAGSDLPPLTDASAERVLEEVRASEARVVVVNLWATWCAPCLEELPDLLRLRSAYADRGLRLILVSADFPNARASVRERLASLGVGFETFLRSGNEMAFIEALSEDWTGALPATLVYDGAGRLVHVVQGKASFTEFETLIRDVLGDETPAASRRDR